MSYHFLWKRGIRPARTEQFLVLYILSYEVLNKGIRVALLSFVVTRHLIIVFVMSDFAVPSFLKVFFLVRMSLSTDFNN